MRLYEEMLERTETEWAPWTIVEATDKRHTTVKVYQTVIEALEKRLGTSFGEATAAAEAAAGEQAKQPPAPSGAGNGRQPVEPEPVPDATASADAADDDAGTK
jgi:hypothetical protein